LELVGVVSQLIVPSCNTKQLTAPAMHDIGIPAFSSAIKAAFKAHDTSYEQNNRLV